MESEVPHRGIPPLNDGLSAAQVVFPQSVEEFEMDPRVSYSRLDSKWILDADDGSEWEWNEGAMKWIPSLDEALLEQQQAAYKVPGVDETAQVPTKKRKNANGEGSNSKKSKAEREPPKNTAVYVTSLPLDATVEEVEEVFSRYGVIAEEIDSGNPRIKLYTDEKGNRKGDGLVVYFRPESVDLAINMLDDSDFRLGEKGPDGPMRVKAAERSYKKVRPEDQPETDEKKKGTSAKDKKKIIQKTQKLNNKLADWDDDDPSVMPETSSRLDKVVFLKHMFTLEELEEDPAAVLDIKEDIREECSKLGEVTNVVLFDKEKEGVVSVRYANPQAARACVSAMNGRNFGGQVVEAFIASGKEKYKKSAEKAAGDDVEKDDEKRLDKFSEWIEQEGAASTAAHGPEVGGGEEVR